MLGKTRPLLFLITLLFVLELVLAQRGGRGRTARGGRNAFSRLRNARNNAAGNGNAGNNATATAGQAQADDTAAADAADATDTAAADATDTAAADATDTAAADDPNAGFCDGKGTPTNGLQIRGGSCASTQMGELPPVDNMVSTIIRSPANGATIGVGESIPVTIRVSNLDTGFFDDPQAAYYAQSQELNGDGIIKGHHHITVQQLTSTDAAPDPQKFAFFQGLNNAADGAGNLETVITAGLPAGEYRMCTIASSSGHQQVLMPVARRGAQDDCIRFTVGDVKDDTADATDTAAADDAATDTAAADDAATDTAAAEATDTAAADDAATDTAAADATTTAAAPASTATAKGGRKRRPARRLRARRLPVRRRGKARR